MAEQQRMITFVSVGWTAEEAPEGVVVSLEQMRKYCRPERIEELLADLTMLCCDVQDHRDALHLVDVEPRNA
jgi:hypothetical protein